MKCDSWAHSWLTPLQAFILIASPKFGLRQTWWPMEGSKLGGPWNVPSLVVNRETSLFNGHWKVPSL